MHHLWHQHRMVFGSCLVTMALIALAWFLVVTLPSYTADVVRLGGQGQPPATIITINDQQVPQFPPPATLTVVPPTATGDTTVTVQISEVVKPRAPYTAPESPSLQVELSIPITAFEQLRTDWSEERQYKPGEDVLVGPTNSSRDLAQRYLDAFNALRAREGLPPLVWDDDLAQRAEGYAATQLWYWLLDPGKKVLGSYQQAIDHYYGIGRPGYPLIGMDSHPMPTALLVGPNDTEAIVANLTGNRQHKAPYGPAFLPVTRFGVGIAVAQNGESPVPHGWLVFLFQ